MAKYTVGLSLAAFVLATSPAAPAAPGPAKPTPAVPIEVLHRDWMDQDHGPDVSACFQSNSGADVEAKMVAKVLVELGASGKAMAAEADRLAARGVAGDDPRWRALYLRSCGLRRAKRLAPLLRRWRRIVFTKHHDLGGSHYAYTEGQSDAQAERYFRPGSALCVLEPNDALGSLRVLLADTNGMIRDPDVSHDGKRILFAWKTSNRKDDYHLYEMDAASGVVRQITRGAGLADYEGAYLPDGGIVFSSTRCVQIVDCWWTEVSNLYTCDADGRFLRRLGFDQVHTNYPTVTDDGRVIYTRWDYNDRGQVFPQPLFHMNPDGTAQTELYGNNSWFPTTILHARGIPGTQKILAVLSGHHCAQRGKLAVIDPTVGQQEATGVQLVAPVRETQAVRVDAYGQSGPQFQYPYPLDERRFLVAHEPHAKNRNRRLVGPFGIYFMDVDGRRELLAFDAKISCNQPVPLSPRRRPPLRASSVDYRRSTGVFYVKDVYAGPGLAGVPRGSAKRLRVVALEYRAAGIGSNGSGGPAGGAMSSTPVSVRNASWDVKKVLGETPIHADGSAMFSVPARTPVYFQVLDANGFAIQTMRSWSTLQPGETFSCVGCHEPKADASAMTGPAATALRQDPKPLEPFYGPARGFSFPKEIQPILDRHCIRCHSDRSKVLALAASTGRKKGQQPGVKLMDPRPLLPIESAWRYATHKPKGKWTGAEFDDSAWKTARGGFGTRGTPGGKVRTLWNTKEIWLRTTFALAKDFTPGARFFAVRVDHDEDIEVYVNARRVARQSGFITSYKDLLIDASALRPGKNLLAVRCRQTRGGQFIDVGLYEADTCCGPDGKPVAVKKPAATPKAPDKKKPAKPKPFSLLAERSLDKRSKRMWSDSYLALTQNGRPNPIVQWLNVQSIPPMLPPYHAGAARSRLIAMLREGHNDVRLSREEMDKLCCWIDLLVPFCGDYLEASAWSDGEKAKYARYQKKRDRFEADERRNIEALVAYRQGGPLPPARARANEYRNVALNPDDVQGRAVSFPHASSNSEYRNLSAFAARCAIDGKTANRGHGGRFPSWGPDRRKDLWWQVEFPRAVEIDKIVLYIRADFPHDRHWHSATIEFSDGHRKKIAIRKTHEPQTFSFAKRTVTRLRLVDLVQDEPLGWCALTEVQVWGRQATERP